MVDPREVLAGCAAAGTGVAVAVGSASVTVGGTAVALAVGSAVGVVVGAGDVVIVGAAVGSAVSVTVSSAGVGGDQIFD
jgi:hypothetical protein